MYPAKDLAERDTDLVLTDENRFVLWDDGKPIGDHKWADKRIYTKSLDPDSRLQR